MGFWLESQEEWRLGTCIAGPSSCHSCGQSGPSIAFCFLFVLFCFEQSTSSSLNPCCPFLRGSLPLRYGDIFCSRCFSYAHHRYLLHIVGSFGATSDRFLLEDNNTLPCMTITLLPPDIARCFRWGGRHPRVKAMAVVIKCVFRYLQCK